MAPRREGQIIERRRATGTVYALRFRAYGRREYLTLGFLHRTAGPARRPRPNCRTSSPMSRRGLWKPPQPNPVGAPTSRTRRSTSSPRTGSRRTGRVAAEHAASTTSGSCRTICCRSSTRHRLRRSRSPRSTATGRRRSARACSRPTSINKTITRLAQILEVAVEYELIDRNPAKGKRRQREGIAAGAGVARSRRADHGATRRGRRARPRGSRDRQHVPRRAILATLVFAGLRIGELFELRWRDVDLSAAGSPCGVQDGRGRAQVDLLPALRDELRAHKARRRADAAGRSCVPDATRRPTSPSNIRNRGARAGGRARERAAERTPARFRYRSG